MACRWSRFRKRSRWKRQPPTKEKTKSMPVLLAISSTNISPRARSGSVGRREERFVAPKKPRHGTPHAGVIAAVGNKRDDEEGDEEEGDAEKGV